MKTYLTAIDFSSITPKVIEFAAELASDTEAKLVVIHVADFPPLKVPIGYGIGVVTPPALKDPLDLSAIKEKLEQIVTPLRAKGMNVETIATIGLAPDEILSRAKSTDASMIILGSHGHGALLQFFGGSVVTTVLQRAEMPVTVIPFNRK